MPDALKKMFGRRFGVLVQNQNEAGLDAPAGVETVLEGQHLGLVLSRTITKVKPDAGELVGFNPVPPSRCRMRTHLLSEFRRLTVRVAVWETAKPTATRVSAEFQ